MVHLKQSGNITEIIVPFCTALKIMSENEKEISLNTIMVQ